MKREQVKRWLAAALTFTMTAGMLAGCGNTIAEESKSEEKTENTQKASETAETSGEMTDEAQASNGEVPTLVWWTTGGTPPADFDEAVEKISDYTEEKIGVRLQVKIAGWADYGTKMNNIVNTGEYFDIMFVNNTNYNKFVNLNALEDITDLVKTETPELYDFIPEELWKGVEMDGSIYAVPTYKDSSKTQFWLIDDQYVQKYDIDMDSLSDFASLDPVIRKMKEGEGNSFYPVQMYRGGWSCLFNNYDGLTAGVPPIGVRIDDESRTVVCTLEQEDIQEEFNYLHSWFKDGLINPDANVLTESLTGLPITLAQGWSASVTQYETKNGVEKYDMVKFFGPHYSTETIQGSLNAISSNSKYKKEALKLLQLMNTDSKLRDMCAYGTEGNFMKYEEDGTITRLRDDWTWPSYTEGTFFILSTVSGGDPDEWNQVKEQNESATPSTCLGFSLNIADIQNELSNCTTVWEKYKYDLVTGAADPETVLPQCIEELKAAGMDVIIEEAQRQIDEYFAE